MSHSYITLSVGILVTLCFCMLAGRLAGLGATAGWMVGTAYFVMPPVFSFQVESLSDWAALAVYAFIGIVFVKNAPSKGHGENRANRPCTSDITRPRADLAEVLRDVSAHLNDSRLDAASPAAGSLHCCHAEAVRVLSDTVAGALADPGVRRITVQKATLPGRDLLFVTACRIWPMPEQRAITIGTDNNVFEGEFGEVYRITLLAGY